MLAFVLVSICLVSAASAAMSAKKAEYFVDVAWLAANLDKVVVLDARSDKHYAVSHIPGAIHSTWTNWTDRSKGKQGDKGWNVTMEKSKLEAYVGSLGIDGSKPIVVYGDPSGLAEDGRVMWELRLVGVNAVKLLDGGFPAWKAAGKPVTADAPKIRPAKFAFSAIHEEYRVLFDEIRTNPKKCVILDTRSRDEYIGKINHGEKRNGHIPGAVFMAFNELYHDDGTVMDVDEIQKHLESKGVKKDQCIITYCTIGIRSGFTALMLRMAGYDARNYEASYSEWAGDVSLPIEK